MSILLNRTWSMPCKWTFQMKPVQELLQKYNAGKGWIDPFAGMYSPAEIRNDIDQNCNAQYHLDALKFMEQFTDNSIIGILLDPPYSSNQALMTYKNHKLRKITPLYNHAARILQSDGYLITFGWHSNGAGKERGFKKVEILLIAHGGERNDTIITVEQKIFSNLI